MTDMIRSTVSSPSTAGVSTFLNQFQFLAHKHVSGGKGFGLGHQVGPERSVSTALRPGGRSTGKVEGGQATPSVGGRLEYR